jgi:hypothetical protein
LYFRLLRLMIMNNLTITTLHIPITDDRALSLAADLIEAVRRRHAPALAAMPEGERRHPTLPLAPLGQRAG